MNRSDQIETALEKILAPSCFPLGNLGEAARYSLLGGGKRLRPKIVLETSALYGVPFEHAILPACALELIHTYSLIHDDLPCMDNDDMRRGKPSLHKKYSEWHALLTGDFLLTYAFEIIACAPFILPAQKLSLIEILSKRAGALGMIRGQEVDLALKGKEISWETLKSMHLNKTAALMTAAFEFGGILGNSPHMEILHEIGQQFGLLFQLKDDLEDVDDLLKEKPSALHLLGAEKTSLLIQELQISTLKKIQSLGLPSTYLENLIVSNPSL